MEMLLRDYLKAREIGPKVFQVTLSNGQTIIVRKDVVYNGTEWLWRVGTQLFSRDKWAKDYLKRLITEKLTGIRIIYRARDKVPEICGIEGRACRAPGECNRALCSQCPVADSFFAKRDGVKLIYAADIADE